MGILYTRVGTCVGGLGGLEHVRRYVWGSCTRSRLRVWGFPSHEWGVGYT